MIQPQTPSLARGLANAIIKSFCYNTVMSIMLILIGILLIAAGIVGLVFNQQIFNFTGSIDFVEQRFPGNSSGFIKILCVVMVLTGIIIATNSYAWFLSPISNYINSTFPAK